MCFDHKPLVSVCIPTYNNKRYIDETLRCVLNQTYSNIEVIISDDCSMDGTVDIIKGYMDSRIKIHENRINIGLIDNFTMALSYGAGKYLMLLCADDGIELDAVEKGVGILESYGNSDIAVVNTYIKIINDEGKAVYTKRFIFGGGRISSYWGIRSNLLCGTNVIGEVNGSIFRKEAYEKIAEPKIKNGNKWTVDLDLKFELLLIGNGYVIPEALGRFRISDQSTSAKELRFEQARLFRQYAFRLYNDKRYKLSFFWVVTSAINSLIMQVIRNLYYVFLIKNI